MTPTFLTHQLSLPDTELGTFSLLRYCEVTRDIPNSLDHQGSNFEDI